jgi:hypothetical protein
MLHNLEIKFPDVSTALYGVALLNNLEIEGMKTTISFA